MPRYQVELPEEFDHFIDYRVVYSDINAANHLGADRVLPIALEAQFSFIRSLGYEDAVVFENAGLIMVSAQTDYLSEAYYGEALRVGLAINKASDKSIDLRYSLTKAGSDQEVARVQTRLLFFDYDVHQVSPIPQGFVERCMTRGISL
ncbi:MAG: hypothetical protein C9356_18575 [Oleiphilus sp.]|nr:MAG: hypothetical protein C9356_18575 [Oleiphilus sp.]